MSPSAVAARPRFGSFRLAGLFLLLVLGVYGDTLFSRRSFGGRDLGAYNLPIESVIHDAYARGRLPVWNPWISGGRPLMANPNSGALYPIRPLLSLVPFPLASRLFPLLHWALAGAGMIFLLRRLDLSAGASWIGAITYVFSGVGMSEVFYTNHHPGVMLLPWIVWALARPFQDRVRQALALGLLFGLDFLAGDVFTIGIAIAACLLWILLEVRRPERKGAAAALAGSLALAGLFALPQILATLLWVPQTHRGVLGMRLGEAVLFSISPFRLLEFVVPFPFGPVWTIDIPRIWGWPVFHSKNAGFFSGLYAGAFAVVAAAVTGKSARAGARFARVLALAALAVSVLPSVIPDAWARLHSPIPLRYPEKFAVAAVFALGVLAALAVDALRGAGVRLRWPLFVGILLTLLAAGSSLRPDAAGRLAARVIGAPENLAATAAAELPAALTEAALFWIATVVALDALKRGTRGPLLFSLALLTAVPVLASRRIARTFPEELLFAPTPFARYLDRSDPDRRFRTVGETAYRPPAQTLPATPSVLSQILYDAESWIYFTPALWKRGTVLSRDFDAGDLSRMETLRRLAIIAAASTQSAPFFGSLSLRWGIRYRDQEPVTGYRRFRGDTLADWDEHGRAYPDVRLLESWQEESGAIPALGSLQRLRDGEVVIESGSRVSARARPGRVDILENTPETLRVETRTADATWLFVLRGYWTYRTILLDGKRVEDSPAQLAFSAVPVPAGRHRIEWRENLPGWTLSRWGPVLFLLAVLWILRRRSTEPPSLPAKDR